MSVTLVAAVGRNGVIGRDGQLPWPPTGDLKHFKRTTMGHTLVMGRKTYDSIGRPLPGRTTIVVTRQPRWHADGVTTASSLDRALALAEGEVFVIGGGEIYRQAMPRADALLITEVDQAPDGDTTFPEIDPAHWVETSREQHDGFAVVTHTRRWVVTGGGA
ncbi:MAG TPA: dihydrofolate reductase [Actinomycetales bacterium]|nr:dihydrofolate reductase [Actinomycetales bacterium]